MSKGKIVLISCLMLVPILFKKFLGNLGWNLTPEALIYLLLGFGSFLVIAILVTSKEARKFTILIPITFILLFGSSLVKDHKAARVEARLEAEKAAAALREAQVALISQRWQQEVVLAQQHEGVLLEVPEEGWYTALHSGGKIFDNRDEYKRGSAWDIWGGGSPPRGKEKDFLYPGLQSQQLVINPDGEGKTISFPDGERITKFFAKKFVVIERNEYAPLVNGERDYSSIDRTIGSWTFQIRKD